MKNQIKEIPDVPLGETVEDILPKKQQQWQDFFTKISSRIKVRSPQQFFLDELEVLTKKSFGLVSNGEFDTILISDWPKQENVAFIVRVDMSMPGKVQRFCTEDYSLFVYSENGGIAYDLSYFSVDEEHAPVGFEHACSLRDWEPHLLTWEFRAKLIIGRLKDLQKQVPDLPE